MHLQNVALLYDPAETDAHQTAVFLASQLREERPCLVLPVDRHLPSRIEELSVDAAVNLVTNPQKASEVRALGQLLELPVSGPSMQALQLCADRALLKDFLNMHNLSTPAWYVPRHPVENLDQEHRNFGFPALVRARRGSTRQTVASNLDELHAQVLSCRCDSGSVIVERQVPGTRVCCALWRQQTFGSAQIRTLDITGGTETMEMLIPPRISPTRQKTMERLAGRLAQLLDVHDAMLVTLVQDEVHGDMIVDVDILPSLHRNGTFARIGAAFGLSPRECITRLVAGLDTRRFGASSTRSAWMCG